MPESDLNAILDELERSSDNRTSFGETWSQGRSAFGGIATAFATTGMRKLLEQPQPMRSLLVSFIAPVPPGEVTVSASIQRRGKNVTQTQASVLCQGEVCLQAMAAFGNPRTALEVPASDSFNPSPRESGLSFVEHSKRVPEFLQYFEGYWVDGGMPFAGKPQRHLNMWVRHRSDMTRFPVESLVTIADIPPPVILSYFEHGPVPSSSLTWSLDFVEPPESVRSEWLYLEFVVDAAADGYTQQSGRIYDEDGRLCALTRQTMVYFG